MNFAQHRELALARRKHGRSRLRHGLQAGITWRQLCELMDTDTCGLRAQIKAFFGG